VLRREGDDAPGIASTEVLGEISSAVRDAAGRLAWTVQLRTAPGLATNSQSVLYLDDAPVLQSGEVAAWPGANPGTTYVAFHHVRFAGDRLFFAASIDDPTLAGFTQPYLGFVDPVSGAQEKVAARGDPAPGTGGGTFSHVEISGEEFVDADAAGRALYPVNVDGVPGAPLSAIYLDDVPLAISGQPSPLPGRDWQSLTGPVSLGASGTPLFRASLDGASATSDVLVQDGAVVAQTGVSSLAEIAPATITSFLSAPVTLGDDGDLLHHAFWSGAPNGLKLEDSYEHCLGNWK